MLAFDSTMLKKCSGDKLSSKERRHFNFKIGDNLSKTKLDSESFRGKDRRSGKLQYVVLLKMNWILAFEGILLN